jgi:hypothetical protein
MRRISEVSRIPRNSLSFIGKGQIAVTPIIVERFIRAMTNLNQFASDQTEFERTVREELSEEIEQRGLRRAAKSIGIDASNLGKMVGEKRKMKIII